MRIKPSNANMQCPGKMCDGSSCKYKGKRKFNGFCGYHKDQRLGALAVQLDQMRLADNMEVAAPEIQPAPEPQTIGERMAAERRVVDGIRIKDDFDLVEMPLVYGFLMGRDLA